MARSSIRYVDRTYIYGQQAVAAPVSNPVIYGRFPKHISKKSSSEKINKLLNMVLVFLVLVSAVSYYFVSDSEKKMNSLGREIVALSNENIELQNKLDNLHSFNKLDIVIHNKTMLDKAKKVIRIPAVNVAVVPKDAEKNVNYMWSVGY
ncbi:hypothetical protein IJD44_06140 [bacterium]|nr:hypothetical protein [bacterium]